MKTRWLLIRRATLVLAAGATIAVGQSGFATGPGAPVALRGPIPDGAESVTVSLLPRLEKLSKGESAAIVPLTTASIEVAGGQYTIAVDPNDIPPRFVDPAGVVDFEINARMPDGSFLNTEASSRITRYAQSGQLFWTDPSTTVVDGPSAPSRGGRASVGVLSPRIEVEDDGSFVEDQYVPRAGVGGCSTSDTGQRRNVSTTIGTAYPYGGVATGWMAVSSSQGADYGIGASGDNNVFVLNGSRFTQDGWSFTWSADARARSFRKEIHYGKYYTICYASQGGQTYSVDEWKWRPISETGGVSQNFDIARPNWTRCANVDAGTWSRDSSSGNAYKYGAAVKFRDVIGIDLSIKRQYSSQQKLVYGVAGNNKALCGSDAAPASAGKIMMKRR